MKKEILDQGNTEDGGIRFIAVLAGSLEEFKHFERHMENLYAENVKLVYINSPIKAREYRFCDMRVVGTFWGRVKEAEELHRTVWSRLNVWRKFQRFNV